MASVDQETSKQALAEALAEQQALLPWLFEQDAPLAEAASLITDSLRAGGRLLGCGNGGSAADVQHIAAEFVGRFARERKPYSAIALHANTSALTAIGNDYGYDEVFARQVRAHGRAGDVLLAISTSGSSPNVLAAITAARELGIAVIGLTGGDGGAMATACDVTFVVPARVTPRIQEVHILLGHLICKLAEDALCE